MLSLKQILSNEEEYFVKIGNCCDVSYGDGGFDRIRYPLYLARNINLPNNHIFKERLLKLGDIRNDWHPHAPVQEIIDPELYPVYFLTQSQTNNLNYLAWGSNHHKRYEDEKGVDTCISPERFRYHWKTSEFVVGKSFESVSINGQIPGVDDIELNRFFEQIFQRMLPAFNKIGNKTK